MFEPIRRNGYQLGIVAKNRLRILGGKPWTNSTALSSGQKDNSHSTADLLVGSGIGEFEGDGATSWTGITAVGLPPKGHGAWNSWKGSGDCKLAPIADPGNCHVLVSRTE